MPIAAAAARVIFTVDVDAGYPASDLPGLRQIETRGLPADRLFSPASVAGNLGPGAFGRQQPCTAVSGCRSRAGRAWRNGLGSGRALIASRYCRRIGPDAAPRWRGRRPVTVLLMHDGLADVPLDVLARHGIRAVRPAAAKFARPSAAGEQLLGGRRGHDRGRTAGPRLASWHLGAIAAVHALPARQACRATCDRARLPRQFCPHATDDRLATPGLRSGSRLVCRRSASRACRPVARRRPIGRQTMAGWLATTKTALRAPAVPFCPCSVRLAPRRRVPLLACPAVPSLPASTGRPVNK